MKRLPRRQCASPLRRPDRPRRRSAPTGCSRTRTRSASRSRSAASSASSPCPKASACAKVNASPRSSRPKSTRRSSRRGRGKRKRSATWRAASGCTKTKSSASNSCRICARRLRWPKQRSNSAQFNSNYAAIVAPRDGTVLRKLAEERELVAAGTPVLVVGAQDQGFIVRTGLADREIVQVRIGDAAQVRLDALPGATLDGKVTEVASAADAASGMFRIEVALDPDRSAAEERPGREADRRAVVGQRGLARLCADRRDRRRRRPHRAAVRARQGSRAPARRRSGIHRRRKRRARRRRRSGRARHHRRRAVPGRRRAGRDRRAARRHRVQRHDQVTGGGLQ